MTVVDVRDLSIAVGERDIVRSVSFTLAAGEVTALVGESGSGKTTTALALLGEHPAGARVSGRVEVAGAPVPPAPGTVGYLPQHPSAALNPVRRIGPVLHEIAHAHVRATTRRERRERTRARVREAMRQARLPDAERLLRRYPHQLSGGQQQRMVLAHELAGRPRVLIADEPTTGQDGVTRGQLVAELRAVAQRGVAVLLLTHDLDLVRALANQVLVMHSGEVLESGTCSEVLGAPRHSYTRRLVEAQPDLVVADRAADSPGRPLMSVRGLTARHGRTTTLHDISLDIHPGDRLAVLGRSGSGKTTLARCLAGLHPHGGEIRLGDQALAPGLRRRSRDQLARVQYVFQDARASFNEFAPVLDQVARTAERLRGASASEARVRAADALARLGVAESSAARRPRSLSGGELQRAALVRAVLAEPDVLICDEITSGLDAVTQAELLDVLAKVQQDTGCALVVITHDLGVVAELADRVLVLHAGRAVEQGPTARLLADPQHAVTAQLVAAAKDPAAARTDP
ncbi:ABC transporter ATP-binding protein [Saccharopolyspora subtropica]|uniref:ABC transporter ATP-binding protein n=1 Tax=Saccharopolyspora thermophila TaxID=89367 RepID=A0A917JW11_9PSEU|nr:ABC transporter ATP-binding protein [Saccharopolyspora subtropica]GGI89702.1 ABC transporter ATP-binding protein [Saccharopolyspora subtropica]